MAGKRLSSELGGYLAPTILSHRSGSSSSKEVTNGEERRPASGDLSKPYSPEPTVDSDQLGKLAIYQRADAAVLVIYYRG
jgi:hypothetical protein